MTDTNNTRHEGVECAYCEEEIAEEEAGASTPCGSMHKWCAVRHEHENPSAW